MTILETRRYAMLARVRDFGEAHRGVFPESSEGGQAFATVAAAVATLAVHARSKMASTRNGLKAKVAARRELVQILISVGRTARAIAERTPGFDDPFQLPKDEDDRSLLTAAQVFVEDAESRKARFVGHGLPETFVADLRTLTARFEEAMQAATAAKERRNVARKGIAATIIAGLAAVHQLDVIVVNQLERDLDAMAQWEEARKVAYPRRRRYVPSAGAADADPRPPVVAPPVVTPPAGEPQTSSTNAPVDAEEDPAA